MRVWSIGPVSLNLGVYPITYRASLNLDIDRTTMWHHLHVQLTSAFQGNGLQLRVLDLLSKRRMIFLRLIDLDGNEHYVVDVGQLYELIKAGKVNYECLVRDDSLEQWVLAREHPYFIKIRDLAGRTESTAPSHFISSQYTPTKQDTTKPAQIDNKTHGSAQGIEGRHKFLIASICLYGLVIVMSLVALKLGVQVGRKALVILIATPILFTFGLRACIPLLRHSSQHRHSAWIPISAVEALARDGRLIIGGALITSVLFAAAVALGI